MKIVIKTSNSFIIIQLLATKSASYFLIVQRNKNIFTKQRFFSSPKIHVMRETYVPMIILLVKALQTPDFIWTSPNNSDVASKHRY